MQRVKGWQLGAAIAAIFFVSLNLRPSITSIGPLLNTISSDLNITNTQVSLLTSIPVFCMGLFAPLTVPVLRKLGYRWAVNLLIIVIGISTALRIMFGSYAALIITSFVAGLAIAIISPMINAFIKERFPQKLEPVIGVYSLAMGAGATLSAGFTGIFFEKYGSWQIALGLWGLLSIPALILWTIASGKQEQLAVRQLQSTEVRNPWKTKRAWFILLFFGLQTSSFFSLTTWLSPVAQEQGFSLVTAASVLTVMSIVQIIGNIIIPILVNRLPDRIKWLYGLLLIGTIGGGIMLIDADWAMWTGAVLFGLSLSGLFPIGLMLPLDEAKNNEEASSWSSMVLSGGFMMSAIVPLLIGAAYDMTGTHIVSKWIFIALFLLMFLAVYMVQVNKRHV
ncbi:CynX/NimT family MFS transporter [Lysinibacillus sp. 3P01SB]|uniref:MFS transporter n=1 Tax=Lysinibacillus sp. 3P01SB TaxID=3132284 RepID=UPI0039A70DE9